VACVGLIAAGPLTDASFARLLQVSAVLFFTGAVISGVITTNSAIPAKPVPRELATVGRDRSGAQPALAGCA
jgi:flagellar motor component MotA